MATLYNDVAVATTSQLAADAAAEVAELGGNAVDCGIAAAMCSINTQPGVCALAGSAFATIWAPGKKPVTIDGNVAIPGINAPAGRDMIVESVELAYGGGIKTLVGSASVAVPGSLAALHLASERYGRLPWRTLLGPSIQATRNGFPLAQACHHYLEYSGKAIYGRSIDGYRALHLDDGTLRNHGSRIVVPHLAATLSAIADEGPAIFYAGEIGQTIVSHIQEQGGALNMHDLHAYAPLVRDSLLVDIGTWQLATNPPPALGGASLAAMLHTFGKDEFAHWNTASLARLVDTQEAVLSYRHQHLDTANDISKPVAELLEAALSGALLSPWASGSTVHTSAVDNEQLACSITASSGYGSGEMPAGTGLWLNNCLGELELNRHGLAAAPPGKRLPSNMAPSAMRSRDAVLAIGSPGADRITTALHQFLVNFAQRGLDLDAAVAHPRLHLKVDGEHTNLAVEPGIDMSETRFPLTTYPEMSMYFGGVAAAMVDSKLNFTTAADPRREGGTLTPKSNNEH